MFLCGVCGHVFQAMNLGREQGDAYHPQIGAWVPGSLNPLNLTKFPAWSTAPHVYINGYVNGLVGE
jgi:glutaredoxin-related protein